MCSCAAAYPSSPTGIMQQVPPSPPKLARPAFPPCREAADKVWLGTAGKPTVTFPLLGSLWLAIALASIPGLYRPLKFRCVWLARASSLSS